MRLNRTVATAVWLGLAGCIPAFAAFNVISTPVAAYTGATTLIPITLPDGNATTTLADGTQTISFSAPLLAATVPGTWLTWGSPPNTESSTPRLLTDIGGTSLTMTLAVPSYTFGFEIEPNGAGETQAAYLITAQFYNGATLLGTMSQNINWQSGALLAAGSDSSPITSVVITAPPSANGFAMAQFRYSTTIIVPITPAPNTGVTGGLAMLLLAAGTLLARARKSAAV